MAKKKSMRKFMRMAATAGIVMQVVSSVMDHKEEYRLLVKQVIPELLKNNNLKSTKEK